MNVNSGGPHILLFERDQQLTALLSGELALAGYEVHTSRTAVEVFDAIARFPIRLVMVNLAQAQAGRREFWVALDAQRRGRGVQVFTFRCSNLGGYGPDDPDEHVQMVQPDQEIDGMLGVAKLVNAVRTRVPGSTTTMSSPVRSAPTLAQAAHSLEMAQASRPVETNQPAVPQQPVSSQQTVPNVAAQSGGLQANGRAQPSQEMYASASPSRPVEPSRSGSSAFTDKIRAVIYPSSRSFSPASETSWSAPISVAPTQSTGQHSKLVDQNTGQHPNSPVQPRHQVGSRLVEADHSPAINREETMYQAPPSTQTASQPAYTSPNGSSSSVGAQATKKEESGLDQLSRLLRESQPGKALNRNEGNGNAQRSVVQPGLSVDPQALQDLRTQLMQAARQDEAYGRSSVTRQQSGEVSGVNGQLRASPIQDVPFEHEIENRRNAPGGPVPPENFARPAITILQPTQAIPPVQPEPPKLVAAQPLTVESRTFSPDSNVSLQQLSPLYDSSLEVSISAETSLRIEPVEEVVVQFVSGAQEVDGSSLLSVRDDDVLREETLSVLPQTQSRRSEVRTTDDTLLDIVQSLPPMAPAPQPPQTQVLSGRATRSLGSVLLEGHLVPQERLQVAQHVQRMLRGVDLNYQLGEILLMFKLLTPDQLLAASLVSYGMISTIQITALGRIRQELHAIGLEYDLESLLVIFRILTPEQLREVRASWSG